jgi:hypothetical protein
MMARYPEIEPYEGGLLDADDGQRVYWEICGKPEGKPAVVLQADRVACPGSGGTSIPRLIGSSCSINAARDEARHA